MIRSALFLFSILLISCNVQPQPINFGVDNCEFCKMTIIDNKFGCEIVTKKGKVFKFDSVECLIHYMKKGNNDTNSFAQLLVTDFSSPGNLIYAYNAFYLHSEKLNSPMGAGLSAYSKKEDLDNSQQNFNGDTWNWEQTYENIK